MVAPTAVAGVELQGRYRLASLLHKTAHGGVFLAQDLSADGESVVLKMVALKAPAEVPSTASGGPHLLDDPQREATAAQFLRAHGHPNIVRYVAEFVEHERLCFVLEHCADGDLYEFARRHEHERLSCVDALSVVSQVAHALEFLHVHNVAHRDVSLENVLLTADGTCKLADFGLAARADEPCTAKAGKAYYMAPEVVAASVAAPYSPKAADVWSLGIVLFVLVSGSPLVAQASEENPAFLSYRKFGLRKVLDAWGVAPRLFPAAIDLLVGMLDTDPATRLTIEQVLAHPAFVEWQQLVERCLAQADAA